MTADFIALVKALGVQANRPDLAPGDNNACELVFDDLPVSLHYLEKTDDIMLYCVIGLVPEAEQDRFRLYARLLEANFFFRRTAGATMAVDERSGLVAMQRTVPVRGLEEPEFLRLVESFLNMAVLWRDILAGPDAHTESDTRPRDAGNSAHGWVMA